MASLAELTLLIYLRISIAASVAFMLAFPLRTPNIVWCVQNRFRSWDRADVESSLLPPARAWKA
jgi:hypothetical protein